jgi:hypothetical protein
VVATGIVLIGKEFHQVRKNREADPHHSDVERFARINAYLDENNWKTG